MKPNSSEQQKECPVSVNDIREWGKLDDRYPTVSYYVPVEWRPFLIGEDDVFALKMRDAFHLAYYAVCYVPYYPSHNILRMCGPYRQIKKAIELIKLHMKKVPMGLPVTQPILRCYSTDPGKHEVKAQEARWFNPRLANKDENPAPDSGRSRVSSRRRNAVHYRQTGGGKLYSKHDKQHFFWLWRKQYGSDAEKLYSGY